MKLFARYPCRSYFLVEGWGKHTNILIQINNAEDAAATFLPIFFMTFCRVLWERSGYYGACRRNTFSGILDCKTGFITTIVCLHTALVYNLHLFSGQVSRPPAGELSNARITKFSADHRSYGLAYHCGDRPCRYLSLTLLFTPPCRGSYRRSVTYFV